MSYQQKQTQNDISKILPHNLEAEQALLGAILVNNKAYEQVSEYLFADHFYHPSHQKVYEAMARLIERGQLANPTTLKTFLEHSGIFADIGGVEYLTKLAYSAISITHAEDYGRTLNDLHLRRQLILIGDDVSYSASRPNIEVTAVQQIEATEQKLFDLVTSGESDRGFQPFSNSLTEAVEMAEFAFKRNRQLTGLATTFTDLDHLLGGLHPSDLIILAGRPSMGKTALATNIAFNVARALKTETEPNGVSKIVDGGVIGFFSLEMSAAQLAMRILSENAKIPSENIRRGKMDAEEFQRLTRSAQDLSTLSFFIDDTPSLSVSALRTRARRLKRQKDLSLIVVDYLQLMQSSTKGKNDNRVNEISEITRGLKGIAKELGVPVIALSQLSRAVESRDDKRPQLSDLRESGSIEQDADVVMFVYRQQYYLERAEPVQRPDEDNNKFQQRYAQWQEAMGKAVDTAEVIIAKQRHGPVGKVTLRFDGQTTKFDNYIADQYLPEKLRHANG
ncbi:MAG: replicative DNA helicase [Alphaproteobacteria bacterium]|nr:replicative DNA helicase [Alphaproteobacteria bacterium]MDP1975657.1 replicative DNA helicase [Alphaproteobacteria bacterium]